MSVEEQQTETPPAEGTTSQTQEETKTETTSEGSLISGKDTVTAGDDTVKSGEDNTDASEPEPLTADAITLPEGVEVAEEAMTEFIDLANKHGLSAEAANELVGLQAKFQNEAAEQLSQFWEQQQEEWRTAAKEEQGQNLDKNLGAIRQLVDEYGRPEVLEVFNLTGAGNNPHVIHFLANVATKLVKEAEPVQGAPSSTPQDRAHRMFPDMN